MNEHPTARPNSLAGQTPVALLFSGGMDSAILLAWLLRQGHRVQPLYVDSGLHWQTAELAAAYRLLAQIAQPTLLPLIVLAMPLADVYGQHWSITGQGVPDGSTPDEAVFLPGRNALLLVKAHLWCQLHAVRQLALGCLASNPFGDATAEFFKDFESALNRGSEAPVEVVRPLSHLSKAQVLALADAFPIERTFSCLSPVGLDHCGRCNKCAERQTALEWLSTEVGRARHAGKTEAAPFPH